MQEAGATGPAALSTQCPLPSLTRWGTRCPGPPGNPPRPAPTQEAHGGLGFSWLQPQKQQSCDFWGCRLSPPSTRPSGGFRLPSGPALGQPLLTSQLTPTGTWWGQRGKRPAGSCEPLRGPSCVVRAGRGSDLLSLTPTIVTVETSTPPPFAHPRPWENILFHAKQEPAARTGKTLESVATKSRDTQSEGNALAAGGSHRPVLCVPHRPVLCKVAGTPVPLAAPLGRKSPIEPGPQVSSGAHGAPSPKGQTAHQECSGLIKHLRVNK